jgi:(4S)-4-hydroxy-5-phosphonooxypentane-2,3-dione isomerase
MPKLGKTASPSYDSRRSATLPDMRLRLFSQSLCAIAILASGPAQSAQAQGAAIYLCTYVELMPNAVSSGGALLKRYSNASRTEPGNMRLVVLHEIARPSRFAILEAWTDEAALDSHKRAANTLRFRDRLNSIQSAPSDERVGRMLDLGRGNSEPGSGEIYVLTHVDVTPDHQNDGLTLLREISIETAGDYGNINNEVLQQANPANHFTVFEAWTSRKALDAHSQAEHTRGFRERLLPMQGGLYDERLYEKMD